MRDAGLLTLGAGFAVLVAAGCADVSFDAGAAATPVGDRPGPPVAAAQVAPMPSVWLNGLREGKPETDAGGRNPFRFGVVGRPAGEDGSVALPRGAPLAPGPGGSARPGPDGARSQIGVTLKFIGTLDGGRVGRVAVLSDGSFVYHGRSGEIVDGRYRILRIGVESIELEVLDDGRRQTIRLTGS